jgi:hypothetical protein
MFSSVGRTLKSNAKSFSNPYIGEWRSTLLRSNSSYLCMVLTVSTFGVVNTKEATADSGDQEFFFYVELLINDTSVIGLASSTTVFALNFTGPSHFMVLSKLYLGQQWRTTSVAQVIAYASVNITISNVTVLPGDCTEQTICEWSFHLIS